MGSLLTSLSFPASAGQNNPFARVRDGTPLTTLGTPSGFPPTRHPAGMEILKAALTTLFPRDFRRKTFASCARQPARCAGRKDGRSASPFAECDGRAQQR